MISDFDIECADLFCGGGGTSTGLLEAVMNLGLRVRLYAVNHWDTAIATHQLNHPNVVHVNSDLEKVDPSDVVKSGKLRLLWASPECTHFSNASGGKPLNKQSRATCKYIIKWLNILDVDRMNMENVREFMTWGPLHPCTCGTKNPKKHKKGYKCFRPIEAKKGIYYRAFVRKLQKMGYEVQTRIINSANHGDATTRKRFYLQACKTGEPIRWPEATHSENPSDMFLKPWRPAEEIIDWSIQGKPVSQRAKMGKKPLAANTMRRIWHGFMKHSGGAFLLGQQTGSTPRSVDKPVMTIASEGAIAVVQPFIVPSFGEKDGQEPRTHSVKKPLPTVTTSNRHAIVTPFLITLNGTQERQIEKSARPLTLPVPAITGTEHHALVEPYIISIDHTGGNGHSTRPIKAPLSAITSKQRHMLLQPYLVKYFGTSNSADVKKPLPTVVGNDTLGLVQPIIKIGRKKYMIDFLYRMLEPKELAAAMSFPEDYKFVGNRSQVVKQIGNSNPVRTARALSEVALIPSEQYQMQLKGVYAQ